MPPLEEQKRIVSRVRALQERIAAATSHLDRALALAESGRSSILEAAYDLALLPEVLRRRGDHTYQPIVTVGDVAVDLLYGSSAKSERTGKIPVLRMGNIQQGEIDWTDLAFTSDNREIERYSLQPGDVLFNRTNSPQLVGKTGLYRGERPAIFAGYLIRIRCSERNVYAEYLTFCLNSPSGRSYCQRVKSDGVSQVQHQFEETGGPLSCTAPYR